MITVPGFSGCSRSSDAPLTRSRSGCSIKQRSRGAARILDVEREVALELIALFGDRGRAGRERPAHADDQRTIVRPVEVVARGSSRAAAASGPYQSRRRAPRRAAYRPGRWPRQRAVRSATAAPATSRAEPRRRWPAAARREFPGRDKTPALARQHGPSGIPSLATSLTMARKIRARTGRTRRIRRSAGVQSDVNQAAIALSLAAHPAPDRRRLDVLRGMARVAGRGEDDRHRRLAEHPLDEELRGTATAEIRRDRRQRVSGGAVDHGALGERPVDQYRNPEFARDAAAAARRLPVPRSSN